MSQSHLKNHHHSGREAMNKIRFILREDDNQPGEVCATQSVLHHFSGESFRSKTTSCDLIIFLMKMIKIFSDKELTGSQHIKQATLGIVFSSNTLPVGLTTTISMAAPSRSLLLWAKLGVCVKSETATLTRWPMGCERSFLYISTLFPLLEERPKEEFSSSSSTSLNN